MNPRTKLFVRLDAQGNKVAGSGVWRKSMPRTGRWVEDSPSNVCCFPYFLLTETPSDVTDDDFTVTIECDGDLVVSARAVAETATTTIDEVVELLNSQLSYLGTFAVDGSDITLKFKQELALGCDEADLELIIAPTA